MSRNKGESRGAVGLFAGIGGIELGLKHAGFETSLICEIDPGARAVLEHRFGCAVEPDIRSLGLLPEAEVIAAGFPCQDLSQAGRTAGIGGKHSGLVSELFKRLRFGRTSPTWLVLENVPFMLRLQRGVAMSYLVRELESLGFTWAYRVIDTQAFGLPQRRKRVWIVASRSEDPRLPLLGSDSEPGERRFSGRELCGFYWTEGNRGLGWAVDAVPTLKGGSGLGIPSPPAIWDPVLDCIATPDIRDAERLQGFRADWTKPATGVTETARAHRWRLIGNAVSVPVAKWLGARLASPAGDCPVGTAVRVDGNWPNAAWGCKGRVFKVDVSSFPVSRERPSLRDFLRYPMRPLSERAAKGFFDRASRSSLHFEDGFMASVRRHVKASQIRDQSKRS